MGQPVHVLNLRDGVESGSLNPLELATRYGDDIAAMARSFALELIQRSQDERDRFWNDWAESMITGGIAWLLGDCEPQLKLSALFDLFNGEDVVYSIAKMMDERR